jgi:N-glycosylase/DNA lyase
VIVESSGRGDAAARRLLRETARRVLNLDLDLSTFHECVGCIDGMEWIARTGSGRLLRAPTLFEDLVKLVLTTNCTWALTTRMVDSLIEHFGESAPDGSRAFPTAGLAREVASGRVDPEAWQHDPRDPEELRREMLDLPGVGPYVAENLLRLLGRPAGLGLDSAVRSWYAGAYHGGRRVSDRTIARRYAKLGSWGGLAVWCEMTREWLEEVATETAR